MCCVRAMATMSSWAAGVLCSAERAPRNPQQRLPSCMGTAELSPPRGGVVCGHGGVGLVVGLGEVFSNLNDSVTLTLYIFISIDKIHPPVMPRLNSSRSLSPSS